MSVLDDVLCPGLRVVFCGTAVGNASALERAYYAKPSNKFWGELHRTGLTPKRLNPTEYSSLPRYGIGLTDLAKKTSGNDANLKKGDFDAGGLRDKMLRFRPEIVAFNGKKAASVALGQPSGQIQYGLQDEPIGTTKVFVLPSTSGANALHWNKHKGVWDELALLLKTQARRSLAGIINPR